MFVSRTISSGFVCHACRATLARAPSATPKSVVAKSRALRNAFSTAAVRRDHQNNVAASDTLDSYEGDHSTGTHPAAPQTDSTDAAPSTPSAGRTSNDGAIPWYLRESPPRYMDAVVPGQQAADIPELPNHPPPLLETLLEYISVTAGLDDLQLLDLRHLDPPPALGPKLIMIIGTARSEKHLHVAADRFCRFLRREHGLKANAAGLLGRNELKIKLRRKAKRMRMLANVGGTLPAGNIDDGIRTGWICCTLGKIEAHPEDQHMPGDNVQDFVGFRDVRPGVNVVVQMFTEEKRTETDLETLWGGVVRTHERKNKSADEKLYDLEQDIDDLENDNEEDETPHSSPSRTPPAPTTESRARPQTTTPVQTYYRPQPSVGDEFPSSLSASPARQTRRLHTVGLC